MHDGLLHFFQVLFILLVKIFGLSFLCLALHGTKALQ